VGVSNTRPRFCAAAGLGRTFQNIKLFGRLTVRQNVEVAHASCLRDRAARAGSIDIDLLLKEFGLAEFSDWKAGGLAYGSQRRLEIVRGLALGPDFLLLDEPAAGMNAAETTALIVSIQQTRDTFGCGVIVIDHDLRFIMKLCGRIYVLDSGRIIAAGTLPQMFGLAGFFLGLVIVLTMWLRPEGIVGDDEIDGIWLRRRKLRASRSVPIVSESVDEVPYWFS